jgi:6-phospho-3-hexuloisomerase
MDELARVVHAVSSPEIDRLSAAVLESRRVFLFALGRTLSMGRAFVMRLVHLGLEAFVVGDTSTPGISARDLLILCSASGATASTRLIAEKAKGHGATVALATANRDSPIGAVADLVIGIQAPSKTGGGGMQDSIQPMATLFEQSLLLTFDLVVLDLMRQTEQNAQDMLKRHANLE